MIPSVLFLFCEGNWNAQKYMTYHKWSQNFTQSDSLGCTKRYDAPPFPPSHPDLHQPTPGPKTLHTNAKLSENFRILRWCRERS